MGELALDGSTRPAGCNRQRESGRAGMLVPADSAAEAAVVEKVQALASLS